MMTENNWFPHVFGALRSGAVFLGSKARFSAGVSVWPPGPGRRAIVLIAPHGLTALNLPVDDAACENTTSAPPTPSARALRRCCATEQNKARHAAEQGENA
jgi:hypothetical protein